MSFPDHFSLGRVWLNWQLIGWRSMYSAGSSSWLWWAKNGELTNKYSKQNNDDLPLAQDKLNLEHQLMNFPILPTLRMPVLDHSLCATLALATRQLLSDHQLLSIVILVPDPQTEPMDSSLQYLLGHKYPQVVSLFATGEWTIQGLCLSQQPEHVHWSHMKWNYRWHIQIPKLTLNSNLYQCPVQRKLYEFHRPVSWLPRPESGQLRFLLQDQLGQHASPDQFSPLEGTGCRINTNGKNTSI